MEKKRCPLYHPFSQKRKKGYCANHYDRERRFTCDEKRAQKFSDPNDCAIDVFRDTPGKGIQYSSGCRARQRKRLEDSSVIIG